MKTSIESGAVGFISSLIPWLAPAPSAYFVWRSTISHLQMHEFFAFVAATVIEGLGIATVHLAMTMHEWNVTNRKSDPDAPTWLAVLCGVAYLIATFGLTIVLEAVPSLSMWAPAIFPVMAVVGAFNLTLHNQQRLREASVLKEKRQRRASTSDADGRQGDVQHGQSDTSETSLEQARKAKELSIEQRRRRLIDTFADDPDISIADVARQFGVSRGTIYNDLEALEGAGRVHRNGNGVEVM